MQQFIEYVFEIAASLRKYASFFEWPDKAQKEIGVAEDLIAALSADRWPGLCNLRSQRPDPPDCVCENKDGERVAIEVTEVVCPVAARMNAQGQSVYRIWGLGELTRYVRDRLSEKDAKRFHGGPYSSIIVCLFTDEPALTVETAKRELSAASFGPFHQVTVAYMLFRYDPGTKGYPFLRLRFAT